MTPLTNKKVCDFVRKASSYCSRLIAKSTPLFHLSRAIGGYAVVARFVFSRARLSFPEHPIAQSLDRKLSLSQTSVGSLVAKRQSLVRWGDGDTLSALGVGNSFEPPNPHLATELIRLLRTATSDPNLHLGLPLSFLNPGSRKNIANNRLKAWGLTLLFLEREIQEPVEVLDSFIFRGTKGAPRLSEQISLTSLLTIISPRPVIAVGPPSFINHFAAEKLKLMAGHVEMAETRAFSELGSLTGQVRNRMRDAPGAVVLVSGGSAGRLLIGRLRGEGSLLDVGQIV